MSQFKQKSGYAIIQGLDQDDPDDLSFNFEIVIYVGNYVDQDYADITMVGSIDELDFNQADTYY